MPELRKLKETFFRVRKVHYQLQISNLTVDRQLQLIWHQRLNSTLQVNEVFFEYQKCMNLIFELPLIKFLLDYL